MVSQTQRTKLVFLAGLIAALVLVPVITVTLTPGQPTAITDGTTQTPTLSTTELAL